MTCGCCFLAVLIILLFISAVHQALDQEMHLKLQTGILQLEPTKRLLCQESLVMFHFPHEIPEFSVPAIVLGF